MNIAQWPWEKLGALLASSVLPVVLYFAAQDQLAPLWTWTIPPLLPTVVISLAGAALGLYYPKANAAFLTNGIALVVSSGLVLLGCLFYSYFAAVPPPESHQGRYELLAVISYFGMIYGPMGFSLAQVSRAIQARSKAPAKT